MNVNNDPQWRDVEIEGDFTGKKYFGRFLIKPFLTNGERADVSRLAEMYNRGLSSDGNQKAFNMTMAFLKFHIVESDATWWTDKGGLDLYDESPIFAIAEKVREVQKPAEKKEEKETT